MAKYLSEKLSRYNVISPPFDDGDLIGQRILFSTRSGQTVLLSEKDWVAIRSGEFEVVNESILIRLRAAHLLVDREADELSEITNENRNASIVDKRLFIVIQPSAFCQLSCDYCGQSHENVTLSDNDGDALMGRVASKLLTSNYNELEIGWFGAEPLNAMGHIKALSKRLRELADMHSCVYSARVVTNGVNLTRMNALDLQNHGVTSVEVTLDGNAAQHDARRATKSGSGTFDRILKNIEAIAKDKQITFRINVRCNVDRRNVESPSDLIKLLRDRQLHRRINSLYFAPIHSWGNDAGSGALSPTSFASRELMWHIELAKAGFKTGLLPTRVLLPCMVFKSGSELVDAYGNLFNCTEVSYVPKYSEFRGVRVKSINKHAIGTVSQGTSGRKPFTDFYDRVDDGTYACHSCELLPACGGKCAKQWSEGIPPCPPEKINLGQRLILDYVLKRHRFVSADDSMRNTVPQPPNDCHLQ